jgi:hypothetical protein
MAAASVGARTGGVRDRPAVRPVGGARAYTTNGEERRVARGKSRRLGARRRPGEGAWAWGGVRPRGKALVWTLRRPARGAARTWRRAARDVAARRDALADYFKLDNFEHVCLPKIVLNCIK